MLLQPRTTSPAAERAAARASQVSMALEAAALSEPDTEIKRRTLQLVRLYDRATMELLEGNEPVKLGALYYVHSTSKSSAAYRIDLNQLTCNCEAGQHDKNCVHVCMVLAWVESQQQPSEEAEAIVKRIESSDWYNVDWSEPSPAELARRVSEG